MAMERLAMRRIREILRLRWALKRSVRETARALGVSTGVVSKMSNRATLAKLSWERVEELDDRTLEELLYGPRIALSASRPEPDPAGMDTELRRAGVTLELLHLEYLTEHPTGLKYTAFCDRYRRWKKRQSVTLRQVHKAGEKCFLDFSGKRPSLTDRETGAEILVELFVAVLGASNYTYAEATRTQKSSDWIGANTNAVEYFGGAARAMVPDQLKSAISEACAYEPTVQRTYASWARHYETAVVPARPRKPRDKAKVEVGVQIAQRWILARLRNETFFTLPDLNARIRQLLLELNSRPMKKLGGVCRGELFEKLERPVLTPLPSTRFEPCEWRRARVSRDYHIALDNHWYSVPHQLVGEDVEAQLTARIVEVFHRGQRVASHVRSNDPFKPSTDPAHRPPNHNAWVDVDPGRLVSWAKDVGPYTETLMRRLLDASNNFYRETRWRSGCGLQRVGDKYGHERTEEACRRALRFGGASYKNVARMLKLGLDLEPLSDEVPHDDVPIDHDQVRGPGYYQ